MVSWWNRWRIPILSTLGLLLTLLVGYVTGRASWTHIVHVGSKVGEPTADWLPVSVDGMMLVGAIMAWIDQMRGYKPRMWSIVALWFGSLGTVTFNVLSAWERGVGAMIVAAFPAVALLITVECVFHPSRRLLDVAVTAVAQAMDSARSAPVPEPAPVTPDAGVSTIAPPESVDAPMATTEAAPGVSDGPGVEPSKAPPVKRPAKRRRPRSTGHPGIGADSEVVEAAIVALTSKPHIDREPIFVEPAIVDAEVMPA